MGISRRFYPSRYILVCKFYNSHCLAVTITHVMVGEHLQLSHYCYVLAFETAMQGVLIFFLGP